MRDFQVDYASTRAMRLKVFRAQVAMVLGALEKEAARDAPSADARVSLAVGHLKLSLAHLDDDLGSQIARYESRP